MHNEVNFFLKYLIRNPGNFFDTIFFYCNLLRNFIARKLFSKKSHNYPSRALFLLNSDLKACEIDQNYIAIENQKVYLELKTSIYKFTVDKNFTWSNIFNDTFSDEEQYFSVIRCYWLIYDYQKTAAIEYSYKLTLIKSFIIEIEKTNNIIFWSSYNTSERLSSISTSIILSENFEELINISRNDKLIKNFIIKSINVLSNNLEYYQNGVTFNHVVNNLKGLFIGYLILGDDDMLEKVSELLFEEIKIIIDEDGFLREGSSHYQLIITRWMLEIEWLCQLSGKLDTQTKFRKLNTKLLTKSLFYFVSHPTNKKLSFPIIGDVSPDFDVNWITDYFKCAYINLPDNSETLSYGNIIIKGLGYTSGSQFNDRIFSWEYSNIARVNYKSFVLFIRYQVSDLTYFPSHAHDDFLSYILFNNAEEVVIDIGRIDYTPNKESLSYTLACSHNSLLVNDKTIQVSKLIERFFPNHYKYHRVKISNKILSEDKLMITFTCDSIHRIFKKNSDSISRSFLLEDNNFVLQDIVKNAKEKSDVVGYTYFSMPQKIQKISDNESLLEYDNCKINISFSRVEDFKFENTFCSPSYSVKEKCVKLTYNSSSISNLYYQIKFAFEEKNKF